jgi:hypothetical protein
MLSNRLKISDSTTMLSGYARKGQFTKYSDTSAMLSGYAKSGQSVKYSDTSSMLSGYAKSGQFTKYSDTASMLSNRLKISDTASMLSTKAPLSSPALTGTPTAPTASYGTNTTQLATTAFVNTAVLSATPAGTVLTGTTLASNITNSSLTSLGNLTGLTVSGDANVSGTVTATNGLNASASSSGNGIGYTSNGATVTQTGNKNAGVTINALSGQITTDNSSMSAGSANRFTVTNSAVKAKDVPFVVIASGATSRRYQLQVESVVDGAFTIAIINYSNNTVAESIVINFVIFKGS